MSEEEKLLWMFKAVQGEMTGDCTAEVFYSDDAPMGVTVVKHGNACWSKSKLDIVFDYLSKGLSKRGRL